MIVRRAPRVDLTYCTNIHAGESWAEVRRNLETYVLAVKAKVAPRARFGVGLRLSCDAAVDLERPENLAAMRAFLDANALYVFTINGFPYGPFHGEPVKERVYRPDWLEDERVAYSDRLARILAALLPREEHLEGSVSTVPGCFRARGSLNDVGAALAANVVTHAATLVRLRMEAGRTIALALEPEPACAIETLEEALRFFRDFVFAPRSVRRCAELTGLSLGEAEAALRRHLGVCLDACHAAVEFEHPQAAIAALRAEGIRVPKIQVSAGLRVATPGDESIAALRAFAESVYLHQTVVRRGDELLRFTDLPDALDWRPGGDEWRVHFHVPIFQETFGPHFDGTQAFLRELLALQAAEPLAPHLEVETYTWDVLPAEHRTLPVADAVARELRWALDALQVRPETTGVPSGTGAAPP